jgi:TRAP-type transport system periplasmic protein
MIRKITALAVALAAFASIESPALAQTKLVFTSMSPAGSTNDKFFSEWADRVNKAANGEIEVVIQNGFVRANFGNVYDRVTTNVVQIGWSIHGQFPSKFVRTEVAGLPFVSDESEAGSVALWRLYETGALNPDFSDIVPLWVSNLPAFRIHLSKPPKMLDNLQGLKIAVTSQISGVLVQKLGGNPISMPGGNYYESIQRGIVDGAITTWAAFAPYKLHEVLHYTNEVPVGSASASWFMTRTLFDNLSPRAKQILVEQSGEKQSRAVGKYFDEVDDSMRQIARNSGKHEITTPEPATLKNWSNIADTVNDEWVKQRPGTAEVLTKYRELLANVHAGK